MITMRLTKNTKKEETTTWLTNTEEDNTVLGIKERKDGSHTDQSHTAGDHAPPR